MQEILTVKSDDVVGRVKTYESIVKGNDISEPGIPESFKVLLKELQALALDMKVLNENNEEISLKSLTDDESDITPHAPEKQHYEEVALDDVFGREEEAAEGEEEDETANIFDDMEQFDDDDKFAFKSSDLFDDDFDDFDDDKND